MHDKLPQLSKQASDISSASQNLSDQLINIVNDNNLINIVDKSNFDLLTIFVLSCFVGYYVVWKVTPALHTPLMAVTNAISGIILIGAIIATGSSKIDFASLIGFFACILASINIFGGFIVTQRMLKMFSKKK